MRRLQVQVLSKAPTFHPTQPKKMSRPKKESTPTTTTSATSGQTIELTRESLLPVIDRELTPYEALVLAISHCQNVSASRINPHFKSKYFGLGDLLAEIKPVFGHFGLAVIQVPYSVEGSVRVRTDVLHKSGHLFSFGELGMTAGQNLQSTGSGLTYLKRYALATIAGVASDLDGDDDGNLASKPAPHHTTQAVSAPARPAYQPSKPAVVQLNWSALVTSPQEETAAINVLQRKGWLQAGQTLEALSADHKAELMKPQMVEAFRQAIKQHLASTPEV